LALLLNPRIWIALALAAFLSFTHFSAYRAGKAVVRADFDAYKISQEKQAREAEGAARLKEQQHQKDYDDAAQAAREENNALQKDVSRLADVSDGLRDDLAAFKRRAKQNPAPSNGRKSEPSSDPLDLLAQLFTRSGEVNTELARYADSLKLAGATCERSADKIAN
jgi:predicted RNase H-like nuclease (RuvC/YqgF family)